MSTTRWFRSLVRRNPDLYRAIHDWNLYPHRGALPVRLIDAAVPEGVLTLLEKSAAGRARLGRHFRGALNLPTMCWDFQPANLRLALLPAATLARLAMFAGAARLWVRLARVVSRSEQRSLTEAVGSDAYAFALRHGICFGVASEPMIPRWCAALPSRFPRRSSFHRHPPNRPRRPGMRSSPSCANW